MSGFFRHDVKCSTSAELVLREEPNQAKRTVLLSSVVPSWYQFLHKDSGFLLQVVTVMFVIVLTRKVRVCRV